MGVKLPTVETCCTIELERGARFIAIAELVLGVLGVILNILTINVFGLILAGLILALAVLLYVGVSKQNQQFIRIYLVVEAVLIILTIIDLVLSIIGVIGGTTGLIWGLFFILRMYFWVVIFSYYQRLTGGSGEVGGPTTTQPV